MSTQNGKFLTDDTVSDLKVRLRNDQYLRARNNAGSGDVDTLKVNTSDAIEFASFPQKSGTPTANDELVNKSYVDAQVSAASAGFDPKDPCDLATTGDITLSGEQTIDGTLTSTSRVLVKAQSTASQNGIYVTAAGAWSRATDADEDAEVTQGMFTYILGGTAEGGKQYVLTTADPITVGSTSLSFAQISSGAAGLTGGDGIDISGSTVSVDLVASNPGLEFSGAKLQVDVDDSSIERAGSGIQVKALGITNAMLAGSIEDGKLNQITTANKVAGSAIELNASSGLEDAGGTGLAVNADDTNSSTDINGSNEVIARRQIVEHATLAGGDISNGYVDFTNECIDLGNIALCVEGVDQILTTDYTASNVSNQLRITWAGGLSSLVATGDRFRVVYEVL